MNPWLWINQPSSDVCHGFRMHPSGLGRLHLFLMSHLSQQHSLCFSHPSGGTAGRLHGRRALRFLLILLVQKVRSYLVLSWGRTRSSWLYRSYSGSWESRVRCRAWPWCWGAPCLLGKHPEHIALCSQPIACLSKFRNFRVGTCILVRATGRELAWYERILNDFSHLALWNNVG